MFDNNLILLGKRISEIRTKRGLSQEGLSEKCGISARHISEIERAKTNPCYVGLSSIADALDVSLIALVNFEHHKASSDLISDLTERLKSLPEDKLRLAYRLIMAISE